MRKLLLTFLLCLISVKSFSQLNYNIDIKVYPYYTKKLVYSESIVIEYLNLESFVFMDSIMDRILKECNRKKTRHEEFGLSVELVSKLNTPDTIFYKLSKPLLWTLIDSFDVVYIYNINNRINVISNDIVELNIKGGKINELEINYLYLIGDTFVVKSYTKKKINNLEVDLKKLIIKKGVLYADTLDFTGLMGDLTGVNHRVMVNYLRLDGYFTLHKMNVRLFKTSIRNIYFNDYDEPYVSHHEDGYIQYQKITGFMKRRKFVSRVHLLFHRKHLVARK